ncbi:hypothetical protein [Bergeriella denitrificans]|uniref:Archaeal ATPase n=1 Tax=Bergeriella denitrificans TaxID=494 RepID=A0A378UIS6_BERDE|nr:hypothetical protein [Bergeriella denitrificans]STZ77246.1 Uncharacterised protein [Bergeriella denitrificans]
MSNTKVSDVYGINRDLPLNYVPRSYADTILRESLDRSQHLVIYGSSKQGKTSLRKHNLKHDEYIVIHCSNKWTIQNIHEAILKSAGFELTISSSQTTTGKQKISASIGTAAILPFNLSSNAESESTNQNSITLEPLDLDPFDVNDIIDALNRIKFNKIIILEDFHYLPTETQKDFSFALKAFHENSKFKFIIIGVWLEENRLSVYNGDLDGRLIALNADKWDKQDLTSVIERGEELLNIEFSENFKSNLVENCFDSVFLIQEACLAACKQCNIEEKQITKTLIAENIDAKNLISNIVKSQSGRFNSFLTQFANGFQATTLEMYKWLLYPILTKEITELEKGIRLLDITRLLKSKYPKKDELNTGNITQALQSVTSLQINKNVRPIILDYDQTNLVLSIVDKSFLIWLATQNRDDLILLVGLDE